MAEILCSTGALIGRPNGRDFRLLDRLSREIKSDGYEFMMYGDWYDKIDEIVSFLDKLGLSVPVYHSQKSIGELISQGGENEQEAYRLMAINAEMAARLGSKKLVMHLWDGKTSDHFFFRNLEAYARLREITDHCGVDLLIENVVCSMQDPITHWRELRDRYPDIHFIYDTKMTAFHGLLEQLYAPGSDWLWQEDHLHHFHVNDYGGAVMEWSRLRTLPIGQGHIDFDRFFRFIHRIGYNGTFTLESTVFDASGAVDTDTINRQIEFIRAHLDSAGDSGKERN